MKTLNVKQNTNDCIIQNFEDLSELNQLLTKMVAVWQGAQ